jgi:SAM-dependent methyltransferase
MSDYGNRQKHLNPNRVQQYLLDRFHHKIVNLISQAGVDRLLDVGCAEGFVIDHLRRSAISIQVIGGDFDAEALLWGRSHLRHGAPLANLDVHRLPFADNQFPLVICLEVLEHLPDSRLGLAELARVSAKYVLVSVPHEPFFRGANFLRGKHLRDLGNDPEHLHNYTGAGFRAMLDGVVEVLWHGYSFPWQVALARKR